MIYESVNVFIKKYYKGAKIKHVSITKDWGMEIKFKQKGVMHHLLMSYEIYKELNNDIKLGLYEKNSSNISEKQ